MIGAARTGIEAAGEAGQAVSVREMAKRFSQAGIRRERHRRIMRALVYSAILLPLSYAKRILDITLSAVLLLATMPIFMTLSLLCGPLIRRRRIGRWCEPFEEYTFIPPSTCMENRAFAALCRLPTLLNILIGDMSFIGPRPAVPGELSPRERAARRRYDVRPGLICLWWIRQRANIAYETEAFADSEYVESSSIVNDLGIALRAIPSMLYGGASPAEVLERVTLLRISINNVSLQEAIDDILARASRSSVSDSPGLDSPSQVCFVNADCANIAYRDDSYRTVLQKADLVLADGIGMKLAGKLLGQEIKQNVNGTDLFPRLCAEIENTGTDLYLLGGAPGVASGVRDWVKRHYPGTLVSGIRDGYFAASEEADVCEEIRRSGASILLVALGAPRQDEWLAAHLSECGVPVGIGVGGLFDYFSGNKPRAPQWVREMGLEWAFRLVNEPRRLWKRYVVGNVVFLYRVLCERFFPPKDTVQSYFDRLSGV